MKGLHQIKITITMYTLLLYIYILRFQQEFIFRKHILLITIMLPWYYIEIYNKDIIMITTI